MSANTKPIYSRSPHVEWNTLLTGNTTKDGTSGMSLIFTGDNNEGGMIHSIRCVPLGTNVATVIRIFLNNGSTTGTAANNSMIAQATLPATTNSEVSALPVIEIPLDRPLPANYDVYAVLGTTVAAGWQVTAFGGKY